jgi:PncC family amidohydrolase
VDLREGQRAAARIASVGPITVADLTRTAAVLQGICLERGYTVATAESCTGGLVGHAITEVAGSSAYYVGGAVVYSDAMKRAMLGVGEEALEHHGAVSAQVAVAMADGARRRFDATVGVAVTGIAGPGGARPGKPVGLTYVAVADADGHDVRRFVWSGDRSENKLASADAALRSLVERLGAGDAR